MNRKTRKNAEARLAAAGHAPWVVANFHEWAKTAGRGWRRTARRVFMVKFA